MPSYKVSNKPRMYFCANKVVCSIHASLLLNTFPLHIKMVHLQCLYYSNYYILFSNIIPNKYTFKLCSIFQHFPWWLHGSEHPMFFV